MDWEELKNEIGTDARALIEDDRCSGNDRPICFMTDHKSTPELKWLDDLHKFHCFNCSETYDILDHSKWLANGDNARAYDILCEWAKVSPEDRAHRPKAATPGLVMPKVTKPQQEAIKEAPIQPVQLISKQLHPVARQYLESRGISRDTMRQYKVTSSNQAIFFNYMAQGKVVKIKGRAIGNMANGRDKYGCGVKKGGTDVLYGQHLFDTHRILAICEGEIDALSLYEGMKASNLDKTILCSSVPSGSSSMSWVKNSAAFISQFESIILIPDNDEAGAKFLEKCGSELMMMKPVSHYELQSYGVNDVNDLLQKFGTKVMSGLLGSVKRYLPDFAVDLKNLPEVETAGYETSGFYTLDKQFRGLRHGLLTIFTGRAGKGKSTIIRQIINHQVSLKKRVGVLMGEEDAEAFRGFLLHQYYGKSHPEYFNVKEDEWENVEYEAKPELLTMFSSYFADYISFFDCAHLEAADKINKIYEWIRFESTVYGTKLFQIDNLMRLESGAGAERNAIQEAIITTLKGICTTLKVHIILIAHPKKDPNSNYISAGTIRGAGQLVDTIDNLIAFQRMDEFDDKERAQIFAAMAKQGKYDNVTGFMKILKNRVYGLEPYIPMRYDQKTNTIHDLDPDGKRRYGFTIPARYMKDSDVPE